MKQKKLLYSLILFMLILANPTYADKIVTIGIVTDGQAQQAGWTTEQFKNELKVLTKGEFKLSFS